MRCLTVAIVFASAALTLSAASLEEVLARMDTAAASFSDVTARVEKVNYTAVINDTEIESGQIWMSRRGGVQMRIEFGEPNRRSLTMAGRKAEIFYPKLNLVNEYDLGKLRDIVDQFLLLGFGTAGKDLTRDYQLQVLGEEEIEGVATTRLELVPKNRRARERLTRAELWVADGEGYPVRQKFHPPSEDTTTLTYSSVEINPGLGPADLRLELPRDVQREYPQR